LRSDEPRGVALRSRHSLMRRLAPDAAAPLTAAGLGVGAAASVVIAPSLAAAGLAFTALGLLLFFGRAAGTLAMAITAVLMSGFAVSRRISSASRWSEVVLLLTLAALGMAFSSRRRSPSIGGSRIPLGALFLLGFFSIVLAHAGLAVLGGETRRAILGVRSWLFFPALFLLGRRIAEDRRSLSILVCGVGVGVVATLAYGVKQFLYGYTPAELALANVETHSVFYEGVPRLSATLPTNQDFAAFLIIALPAAMAYACIRQGRSGRLASIAILFCASGLAVLGMVRSAAIAAAVGSLVVLAIASRERQRRVIVVLVSLLVCAFAVQTVLAHTGPRGSAVRSRLGTLTKLASDPAVNARIHTVWPKVAHAIEQKPLGHGIATTGGPAIKLQGAQSAVIPDNGYLTIGYEVGIPGVLLYVGFLLASGVAAKRATRTRSNPLECATALAACGVVASVLVAMVGASYVQLPTLQVLLFPLLGIAARLSEPV
jgi:hypothetical protein